MSCAAPALDPFDHELHARSYAYLHQLHRFWSYFEFEIDTERRRETLLAAFLLPLAAFTYTNEKRRVLPLISFVMKEGLKVRSLLVLGAVLVLTLARARLPPRRATMCCCWPPHTTP